MILCGFHRETKTYLYKILGEMIHGMCGAELTDSILRTSSSR